ncbi:MAG: methionyl-tRNA formyltransferase [Patescibacteria group bacterium]
MHEKNEKLNFTFFGTPDVAAETLEILKQAGLLPSVIVTSPDSRAGRGMHMQATPAAKFAEENKITCYKNLENIPDADLFVVVAFGKILSEKIINTPKLGSLNIHYSLLPKYRGASPVESAILNGDAETGVTIQKMVYELDAGNIVAQEKTVINAEETAPELRKRLIKQGGELLVKTLPQFVEGKLKEIPQDETQATFCKKIKKEDGLIDLQDNGAKNYNKFRAYATWPRTFFFKDGKRIIITAAALEDGKFVIKKVIPEGGKEQNY